MKKFKGSKLAEGYMKFEKAELDKLEEESKEELRLSDTFLKRVEEIEGSFEKLKVIKFYERPYFKVAGILACIVVTLLFYINGGKDYRVYDKGTTCMGDSGARVYAHAENAFVEVTMFIEHKTPDGNINNVIQTYYDYEEVSAEYKEKDSEILFVEGEYIIEFPAETESYYTHED